MHPVRRPTSNTPRRGGGLTAGVKGNVTSGFNKETWKVEFILRELGTDGRRLGSLVWQCGKKQNFEQKGLQPPPPGRETVEVQTQTDTQKGRHQTIVFGHQNPILG